MAKVQDDQRLGKSDISFAMGLKVAVAALRSVAPILVQRFGLKSADFAPVEILDEDLKESRFTVSAIMFTLDLTNRAKYQAVHDNDFETVAYLRDIERLLQKCLRSLEDTRTPIYSDPSEFIERLSAGQDTTKLSTLKTEQPNWSVASLRAARRNAAVDYLEVHDRGPDRLVLGLEIPQTLDVEETAHAVAELYRCVNHLHISLGGAGLLVDEWFILEPGTSDVGVLV